MRSFKELHPAILFFYFILILFLTMFTLHPIVIISSLVGSMLLLATVLPARNFFKSLAFSFIMFTIIFIINPLFSSGGKTLLFYIFDKPITLESVLFGAATGIMMVSIITWCHAFGKIFTSDKFMCVFARTAPKLSLVLTIALKLLPRFLKQASQISQARKAMGLDESKVKNALKIFSAATTWMFEESIDTASSMEARGYPSKNRTHFSAFDITAFDIIVLIFAVIMIICILSFGIGFSYYPVLDKLNVNLYLIPSILIMTIPFVLESEENLKWILLKSKI